MSGKLDVVHVCSVKEVRAIEAEAFKTMPSFEVMKLAARSVAAMCAKYPDPLLFVAGAGNNGGDAHVAAAMLREQGRQAHVWRPLGDPVAGGDAQKAAKMYAKQGGKVVGDHALAECGTVVDGLFGIGVSRDLDGTAAECVRKMNSSSKPVIAIDVPSGIDCDSGAVRGAAVYADTTMTFFSAKPGLLMRSGRDHAGQVIVSDLGFGTIVKGQGGTAVTAPQGTGVLRRGSDSHKGSFGSLGLVGGADGMLGALVLSARSAVAHGAGKVFAVQAGKERLGVDLLCPEIMWRDSLPDGLTTVAVGMGLGTSKVARDMLVGAIYRDCPLVVDADGLNMVAADGDLADRVRERLGETVITPHPAEAGRLLGIPTADVQNDRVSAALELASRFECDAVLKGSGTVIAGPSGKWAIADAGNPGLAQAGSGDVLTGIICALLAQGMRAWDAAATGAWLHGEAADKVRDKVGGPSGVMLEDVVAESSLLLAPHTTA